MNDSETAPDPSSEIQMQNSQMVGIRQLGHAKLPTINVIFPQQAMTPDQAMRHAAWLVAVAEPYASHPFADVLKAVQST